MTRANMTFAELDFQIVLLKSGENMAKSTEILLVRLHANDHIVDINITT